MVRLIPQLPKSAVEPLKQLLPSLPDKLVDEVAPYVVELESKR